jgi:drug/metabolite transporter (DMT)-like permease
MPVQSADAAADASARASASAALAATVACLCFGASVVVTRYVVPQTTPLVLACLRYMIATVCMLAVLGRSIFTPMPARDRWHIALLGVRFFDVIALRFSASMMHLSSATAVLVVATNPLLPLALSAPRGTERLSACAVAGQLLALTGIVLAWLPLALTDATGADANPWMGDAEVATTVLCGATHHMWSRS